MFSRGQEENIKLKYLGFISRSILTCLLIVNFQKAMMHQISALQPIGHLCKSRPERWGRQCSHPWSASPAPASSQAWLLPDQVRIIEKCTTTQWSFCQIRLSSYQSLIFPQTLQRFWILPDIATSEGARKILFSERKTKNKIRVAKRVGRPSPPFPT